MVSIWNYKMLKLGANLFDYDYNRSIVREKS